MAIVPMYIHEDYNRYDEETAFFEKYSMFENLFKYDVDIYQRLSERLYNKWAKYFLPMFDRILGKGYPESRSVLTEWRSDLCQKYTPKYKYEECSSCNSRMDVGHKEMTESGEYICTRCTGSYKELYEL
jgi:hypothetical protein